MNLLDPVVGDVVYTFDHRRGRIIEKQPNYEQHYYEYVVETFDGSYHNYNRPYLTVVICQNCGYVRTVHTTEGKCLYGPGNWEAQWAC